VKFSICDLYLCQDCYDYRIPITKVGDNISRSKPSNATMSAPDAASINSIRNELLCFVQQKCDVLAVKQLVKLCTDFYKFDEITTARSVLEQHLKHRLTKRQGHDAARKTMEDIVKVCLDPTSHLPVFYTIDLTRFPPVDVTHCDVSALLKELQALRSEVREIAQLKTELEQFRASTQQVSPWIQQELQSLRAELELMKQPNMNSAWPPLGVDPAMIGTAAVQMKSVSTADIVKSAINSGDLEHTSRHIRRQTKVVVGKQNSSKLHSVKAMQHVNVFVTRLDPETTSDGLSEFVAERIGSNNISVDNANIKCEKLKTKFDTYASFSVSVLVDAATKADVIQLLMSDESWAKGVLVRRFYINRYGK